MTLQTALAAAVEGAGYGEATGDLDTYQEWGGSPREIASTILADPAFREALTAALAEAMGIDWSPFWDEYQPAPFVHEATFNRGRFSAAIVAHLLPPEKGDHA